MSNAFIDVCFLFFKVVVMVMVMVFSVCSRCTFSFWISDGSRAFHKTTGPFAASSQRAAREARHVMAPFLGTAAECGHEASEL